MRLLLLKEWTLHAGPVAREGCRDSDPMSGVRRYDAVSSYGWEGALMIAIGVMFRLSYGSLIVLPDMIRSQGD